MGVKVSMIHESVVVLSHCDRASVMAVRVGFYRRILARFLYPALVWTLRLDLDLSHSRVNCLIEVDFITPSLLHFNHT